MEQKANIFLKKVRFFIQTHKLLESNELYIVALSGGADSVALLLTLHSLGIKIEAVHCNFHLRGEESDRDEQFCSRLCKQLNIPLHIVHFDTKAYAQMHHVSIEMAARQLRYNYFHKLRTDIHAKGICVAHHRDDSVETVLLNMVRGTGIHGLRGILPIQGEIIRPLLCVARQDIVKYLYDIHQDYVTDSSNLKNDVKRNKIRLDVIPILEALNPDVKKTIFKTSEHLIEACKFFDAAMKHAITDIKVGNVYNINKLKQQASPEYVLFIALKGYGFTSGQIQEIATAILKEESPQGKIWESGTHKILSDRGSLVLEAKNAADFPEMRFPVEGIYLLHSYKKKIKIKQHQRKDIISVHTERCKIYVDTQRISFPLHLRRTEKGDRFVPFGMNQSKLISDFLTDRKKNVFEKRRQLVLTSDNNEIIWVVGERADNRFRITENSTSVTEISLL